MNNFAFFSFFQFTWEGQLQLDVWRGPSDLEVLYAQETYIFLI